MAKRIRIGDRVRIADETSTMCGLEGVVRRTGERGLLVAVEAASGARSDFRRCDLIPLSPLDPALSQATDDQIFAELRRRGIGF